MKRLCISVAMAMMAILLLMMPVLAAYYIYIITENTGPDYTQLALNMTLDVDGLVDGGYISANGTDTRVTDSSYTVLPHMLVEDRIMWVSDLEGNSTTQFILWTDQSHIDSFPTITGHGGYVTIPNDAALEPGDAYAFGIVGYVDMSGGTNKTIIRKDGACLLDASVAGNLTFSVTGGNNMTAAGLSSGYMTIMVYNDSYTMWIEIDDVWACNTTASAVPPTSANWTLFENDVMPYISYYGQWVVP